MQRKSVEGLAGETASIHRATLSKTKIHKYEKCQNCWYVTVFLKWWEHIRHQDETRRRESRTSSATREASNGCTHTFLYSDSYSQHLFKTAIHTHRNTQVHISHKCFCAINLLTHTHTMLGVLLQTHQVESLPYSGWERSQQPGSL